MVWLLIFILFLFFIIFVTSKKYLLKISFKNIFKKKLETLLMILGSMVGIAFIIGAFGINDSFNNFVYENVDKFLGEIDEVVYFPDKYNLSKLESFKSELLEKDLTDGFLKGYFRLMAIGHKDSLKKLDFSSLTQAGVLSYDFDNIENFGIEKREIPDYIKNLKDDEVIMSKDLAELLDFKIGDEIEIFSDFNPLSLLFQKKYKIVDIKELNGIYNFRGPTSQAYNGIIYLNERTVRKVLNIPENIDATHYFISNRGNTIQGNNYSEVILELYNNYENDFDLFAVKKNQLDNITSGNISLVFLFFSGFSIIAGGILILNMYSMLVDERKKDFGILRANGFKKKDIRNLFFLESTFYTIFSIPFGIASGVGLSYFTFLNVVNYSKNIDTFSFINNIPVIEKFYISLNSIVYGSLIGLLLPLSLGFFYTFKLNKLSIVNAIKDVQEFKETKKLSFFNIIIFLLFLSIAYFYRENYIILLSLFLYFLSLVIKGKYNVFGTILNFLIILLNIYFIDNSILISGIKSFIVIISFITIFILNFKNIESFLLFVFKFLGKGFSSLKIGTAYSLRKTKKTSIILTLYTLIIFLIVVLTIIPYIQETNILKTKDKLFAGFDGVVVNLPWILSKNVDENFLDDRNEITASGRFYFGSGGVKDTVVPILTGTKEFFYENSVEIEGVIPELKNKSSKEIWDFIYNNPEYGVFPNDYESFLNLIPGEFVDFKINKSTFLPGSKPDFNPIDGEFIKVKYAAKVKSKETSLIVGPVISFKNDNVSLFIKNSLGGYFFKLKDYELSKDSLLDYFKSNNSFSIFVDDFIDFGIKAASGVINIINSFLYFGLIIGVIAISITAVKSISERKRIIGMLKAIGFKSNMIFNSVFVENTIIIFAGIISGYFSGIFSSYYIYKSIFSDTNISFEVPILNLSIIAIIIYIISIIFSLYPAFKASKIAPYEAMKSID
ncbi:FtsX-like permease family protein [Oceanotoga sp. DSM 15011]|uniref:ABC transporter permease n=1 Tax=Oceanotoga sp. DSM 15011 TaxID=2984951 RepID=UPI0021F4B09D|nr:FtsX-like permease family protein [Oceanotoga sp. DSM 15011]UYO99618.1 FtsX-like permease family protein [Oceanotoga sp. DSM 15011]